MAAGCTQSGPYTITLDVRVLYRKRTLLHLALLASGIKESGRYTVSPE